MNEQTHIELLQWRIQAIKNDIQECIKMMNEYRAAILEYEYQMIELEIALKSMTV